MFQLRNIYTRTVLFNRGSAKHVVVLAKVHQGFCDDKKIEEHCSRII